MVLVVGRLFTVPLTINSCGIMPGVLKITPPDRLPAGAVAADRTYIVVALKIPPLSASDTLLPNPPAGASETSKSNGAVTVTFPCKNLPVTLNCCKAGLADAVPKQADMEPEIPPSTICGYRLES